MQIKTKNIVSNIGLKSLTDKTIQVTFPYSKTLVEWVKTLDGAKWNPASKTWTIKDSEYNDFRLAYHSYLANKELANPYQRYDCELFSISSSRTLYAHQVEMVSHVLTRHYCILACEMGTGKTLVAIEAAEQAGLKTGDVWYVGPKSGVKAVGLELRKWDSKIQFLMLTYEGLQKQLAKDQPAPRMVIFDESSLAKTPTAQRSIAAAHLARAVRAEHGADGYVVEMSGTPAPKAPTDWWHQCQIAQPGFLNTPNFYKFKEDLCLVETRESLTGQPYPVLVTWWDDANKCSQCGTHKDEHGSEHPFIAAENKVAKLYTRMKGLVDIKFSKDCLDLPELRYEKISVTPSVEILQAIATIKATSSRAISALSLIREVADGFMYKEVQMGKKGACQACHGTGTAPIYDEVEDAWIVPQVGDIDAVIGPCPDCNGKGEVELYERTVHEVGSPKDDVFLDELDAHQEIGRYIVWAGFQGSIDRLTKMAVKEGWIVLQVDGRGYNVFNSQASSDELLLAMDTSYKHYQDLYYKYPKICFVGHPKAGGMALTLTASPTSLFYSNCFDGQARLQAVKRGHRAGMLNRAHVIKDLIMVKTDQLVLDNLEKKRRLQDLTMRELD